MAVTPEIHAATAEPVLTGPMAKEPMGMEALRSHLSDLVRGRAVTMVENTIEQAERGHYQAMKYLFEMIGMFPPTANPDAPREESLAEMLLSRLGIRDETLTEGDEADHVK